MRAGVDTLGVYRSPKNFSSDTLTNTLKKQKGLSLVLAVFCVGVCGGHWYCQETKVYIVGV